MGDDGSREDVTERVRVAVRVRPRNQRESSLESGNVHAPTIKVNDLTGQITICKKKQHESDREARCSYDRVFPTTATQEDVYAYVCESVQQVAQGFNCTIFAYGQTGTGKTHTMLGKGDEGSLPSDPSIRDQWGVIPRAIESLFEELRDISRHHGAAAIVHCSYMQIYNNEVYDLLQNSRNTSSSTNHGGRTVKDATSVPPLAVREMIKGNDKHVYVSGLSAFRVTNVAETLALLHAGNRNRTIRATEFNEHSSRSHAMLQLSTEVESRGGDGPTTFIRRAKLNLVDLAGSEKWATDVSMGMDRSRELTAINQSLSALGNVISALTDAKRTHIPYRDSKLTRLLQDSLGGNTRTVVIATISEDESALEETMSTLQFAERVKSVTVRVRANEVVDDAVILAQAQREIARLKVLLKRNVTQDQIVSLEETVARLTRENAVLVSENKRLRQNALMAMRKSTTMDKESTPNSGFSLAEGLQPETQDVCEPQPPRIRMPVTPRSERSTSIEARPASATLPKQSTTKPTVSQLQINATAAFEAAAKGQTQLLEEIQSERRELEQELSRLEQQQQPPGHNARMETDATVDDDDLCPMCRRVIDDHSDADLDRCIEQESRLAQPVISASLPVEPPPVRATTTPRSKTPVAPRPTRPQAPTQPPLTATTHNTPSPYLQDLMVKTLNESTMRRINVPVPPRKPSSSSTITERPATAGDRTVDVDPRTLDQDQECPPIVRQGSKSVKALKKFQASSPYSTAMSKLRSTADKRSASPNTSNRMNQLEETVESEVLPSNDLRLTNSIRDIGIQLTVYKFRYDCWYPCTIVGFDGKRKLHCCQYAYGDKQWQDIGSDKSKIRLVGRIGNDDD